mmetsp:Transcript_16310/g.26149  ORF Transcript_16310/g.26149 Transcript_16310/m.26149 type:complete len:261 (+) Transcript_16310:883-1665(+)
MKQIPRPLAHVCCDGSTASFGSTYLYIALTRKGDAKDKISWGTFQIPPIRKAVPNVLQTAPSSVFSWIALLFLSSSSADNGTAAWVSPACCLSCSAASSFCRASITACVLRSSHASSRFLTCSSAMSCAGSVGNSSASNGWSNPASSRELTYENVILDNHVLSPITIREGSPSCAPPPRTRSGAPCPARASTGPARTLTRADAPGIVTRRSTIPRSATGPESTALADVLPGPCVCLARALPRCARTSLQPRFAVGITDAG